MSFAILPPNIGLFQGRMRAKQLAVRAATWTAVRGAADQLLEDTTPFVPQDTGALRDSGRVEHYAPGISGVAYGSSDVPYAIYVHEDLEASHDAPTRAKFLEGTYLEHKADYVSHITNAAKGALYLT